MCGDDDIRNALSLEKLDLPQRPKVVAVKHERYIESSTDEESSDEGESIWVNVILADDTPDNDRNWELLEPIDQKIRAALETVDPDLFAYIDFLKQSEVDPNADA